MCLIRYHKQPNNDENYISKQQQLVTLSVVNTVCGDLSSIINMFEGEGRTGSCTWGSCLGRGGLFLVSNHGCPMFAMIVWLSWWPIAKFLSWWTDYSPVSEMIIYPLLWCLDMSCCCCCCCFMVVDPHAWSCFISMVSDLPILARSVCWGM